jgi:hypothetical protein
MPEGNPMGYFTNHPANPLGIAAGGMQAAGIGAGGILAALLGAAGPGPPPTAFSADLSDLARRGAIPVTPAAPATGSQAPATAFGLAEKQQAFWTKFDRMNPAHQQHMARLNAQNKDNPAWTQGYSNWLRGR